MSFTNVGFIIFFIFINIARLIINARIYRAEYGSDVEMDYVAKDISETETRKRDEAGILFLLSLFTLLWLNYAKPENKMKVLLSNVLSAVFLATLAVYFMFIK